MNINDATIIGDISEDILTGVLNIAHGIRREDKNWINRPYTGEEFLRKLSKFERGVKDGACILQGAVVEPGHGQRGVQRTAKNVKINYLMMFDHDTGATVDEIAAQIQNQGLFCVLWTTHSHMKTESWIAESKVLQWMKNNKISGAEPTPRQVLEFLRFSQKIDGKYLTDAHVVRRDLIEGGRKSLVEHAPLPRLRSLFLLKDPFNFATRAGSQKQVIEEWKTLYAGVSVKLAIPYDPSCVDPSRLMYLPRIAADADITQHEIRIIAGDRLDLSTVSPVLKTRGASAPIAEAVVVSPEIAAIQARFVAMGGTDNNTNTRRSASEPFVTTGLQAFLRREGRFFNAAEFMYSTEPEGQRHDYGDGKMDFKCPNEDDHTDASEEDRGFFVTNYSQSDGIWNMRCPHTTCLSASGEDRAWYLDKFCVDHDIKHANELHEFCDLAMLAEDDEQKAAAAVEAKKEDAARVEQAIAPGEIEQKIAGYAALPEADKPAAVNDLIDQMAMRSLKWPAKKHEVIGCLKTLAPLCGQSVADLKGSLAAREREITEARAIAATLAENLEVDATQTISDDPTAYVPLWPAHTEEWTDLVVTARMKAQLERKNGEEKPPRLYRRKTQNGDAGVMRITVHPDDNELVVQEMDVDRWRAELERVITLKKVTPGGRKPVAISNAYISSIKGRAAMGFPILERVVKVPIFGTSGTLITARGYDKDTMVFLDPNFKIMDVPVAPTSEDVDAAIDLLSDALTDFPFSDNFDGDEPLPVKMHDADGKVVCDSTGHPLPHFERGKGSFANTLAMILQPFVQHMIKGPSPAFHIGKANPGSGAGYLMDVVFAIAEGTRATINTMSDNNEELKKQITASLMEGVPIIFIDNINRKVDSGALAAALTSGTWSDRILGASKNCRIEVKSVWVMSGNNKLDFTPELYRRNVPIRLDAKTPNPAQDRTQDFFKHFPLHDWLDANRPRLVHACHVLIANWINLGKPAGTATMNSFDSWAAVLGGILEAAGIEGFLSNIPTYLETKNEDDHSVNDFAQALWDNYKENPFDTEGALSHVKDALGNVKFGLDLDATKGDGALKAQFGRMVKGDMEGRPFRLSGVGSDGSLHLFTLVKRRTNAGMKYQFTKVFKESLPGQK